MTTCDFGNGDDSSGNALTGVPNKCSPRGSPVRGRSAFSAWRNASGVKNVDSFRDIIFQISPNYITCAYKKIFETAAYQSLLQTEDENDSDSEIPYKAVDAETLNVLSCVPLVHVDKSNSCIYNSASALGIQRSASQNDELCAWGVCERAHSASAYKRLRADHAGLDGVSGRTSRFDNFRIISPNVKNFTSSLRIPPKDQLGASPKRLARSNSRRLGSAEPIKPAINRFTHFRRSCSYMEQYREEYTYKRILESVDTRPLPNDALLLSACGSPNCSGLLTSSNNEHRWYPKQSVKLPANEVIESAKTTCVNSAVPLPKRTPVLKKRPVLSNKAQVSTRYVMQQVTRVMDEVFGCLKTSNDVPAVNPGMYRMGVFATSLQVHSYNPTQSVRTSIRSKLSSAETLQTSESTQFNRK